MFEWAGAWGGKVLGIEGFIYGIQTSKKMSSFLSPTRMGIGTAEVWERIWEELRTRRKRRKGGKKKDPTDPKSGP